MVREPQDKRRLDPQITIQEKKTVYPLGKHILNTNISERLEFILYLHKDLSMTVCRSSIHNS